jgi:hypothetical protein
MSLRKDRGSKTETLSLRLDPKTKFIMEFVARINGQTLTMVVERAVQSSFDNLTIGATFGSGSYTWRSFWDPNEGFRTLKLFACKDYPLSDDEEDFRQFVKTHWEFFYTSPAADTPRRAFIETLWPKIEEYRRIWYEQRETDYWAAGRAMAADLSAAKLAAPSWPRLSDLPTQK